MARLRGRGLLPWAALAAGIALIVASVVLIGGNRAAPTDAGALASVVTVTSTATVAPPAQTATTMRAPVPAASPSTGESFGAPKTSSSAPTSTAPSRSTTPRPTAATAATPKELVLPSLGVTAKVSPVQSVSGVLQVPDDISTVGWWQHSVPAGSPTGTTVLDGHIDSAAAGEGALFHLADLGPGDRIEVKTATGQTLTYQVQARRIYVKAQGLPADLFNQQGPARLVIISCGGPFDSTEHSYEDNVAIYATPA